IRNGVGCSTVVLVVVAAAAAIAPSSLERHAWGIVVEHHLVYLPSHRSHGYDRRAGAEQIVDVVRHLLLIAKVLDDFVIVAAIGGEPIKCTAPLPTMAS